MVSTVNTLCPYFNTTRLAIRSDHQNSASTSCRRRPPRASNSPASHVQVRNYPRCLVLHLAGAARGVIFSITPRGARRLHLLRQVPPPRACVPVPPLARGPGPRALSVPAGGLAGARRRARANLAYFAANYQLAFLAVVSVSLLWRPSPICLPTVLLGLFFLSSKAFPVIMALQLFQLMLTGAAASVFVSLPVGLLLVGVHAVLHYCPAEDGAVDEEAGSIVWHRGVPPCDAPAATAVSQQTSQRCS